MRRVLPLVTVLACAVAGAGPAHAGIAPGGAVPRACQDPAFRDLVGTPASERLDARAGAERVFGLGDHDWLLGSTTVASCLFGGPGDDVLQLLAAGGVALGEEGDDVLTGVGPAALTGGTGADLLASGDGVDILRGGPGIDGLKAGGGDDVLEGADGKGEVLDCGPGADTVIADAKDVLLGCETGAQSGEPMTVYAVTPRRGGTRRVFRTRVRSPRDAEGGAFRVLVSSRCAPGLRELRRFPAADALIDRGEVVTVALRPPAGGWCSGRTTGLVVRQPECPPGHPCGVPRAVEVVGRFVLRVRR